ncbi:MAG: MotA/TolQ/ExbB proton channel family protein [Victivallales bacterium]|nr:MotA/TolQ/ExbB proton channel family protein [Victivallales bacterium]MBR5839235.1 MotA/TolQ/ExbB proton channel family protein [Victivallales bacterium]
MGEILGILKDAFFQSDIIGRLIVIALGVASVIAWSIMLYKGLQVFSLRSACQKFNREFVGTNSVLALGIRLNPEEGPLQAICDAGFKSLKETLSAGGGDDRSLMFGELPRQLTDAEIEKVRTSMTCCLNVQRMQMMDQMVILSTIVSLSPFCGLFGTVWGVMMTFVQLAAQQGKKADLGQLAPGVSGALLTTVVGLMVAIPSVFGNNIILNMIDKICADMDMFVEMFIAKLRLERVKGQQEG